MNKIQILTSKLFKKLLYLEFDFVSSLFQLDWIVLRVGIEIGAMSSSLNQNGLCVRIDWTQHAQLVPRVNQTVGEDNVSHLQVKSAVLAIGEIDRLLYEFLVEFGPKNVHTLLYEKVHWEIVAKRLIGQVG